MIFINIDSLIIHVKDFLSKDASLSNKPFRLRRQVQLVILLGVHLKHLEPIPGKGQVSQHLFKFLLTPEFRNVHGAFGVDLIRAEMFFGILLDHLVVDILVGEVLALEVPVVESYEGDFALVGE